jgi:hypothetical protein
MSESPVRKRAPLRISSLYTCQDRLLSTVVGLSPVEWRDARASSHKLQLQGAQHLVKLEGTSFQFEGRYRSGPRLAAQENQIKISVDSDSGYVDHRLNVNVPVKRHSYGTPHKWVLMR